MAAVPLSSSPDLERLREEGFEVFMRSGYLVVDNVPYVHTDRTVRRGRLVSDLELADGVTVKPQNHVVLFDGSAPCDQHGTPIRLGGGPDHRVLADGIEVERSFSSKPGPDGYPDYYAKMSTYANLLAGPAAAIDSSATARTFRHVEEPDDDPPFKYVDTASSRSRITVIMDKLRLSRVAIVGLGGTGSYVLDLIAKTPVRQIDLYDGDRFRQHNAFRSPGAANRASVGAGLRKTEYLKRMYSVMRTDIVSHPYFLDASNVDELRGAEFVFLAIDRGEGKRVVIEALERLKIRFIDVGMGVSEADGALRGVLRLTASMPGRPMLERGRISTAETDAANDYNVNIQIADLNALNAALAVIAWKKSLGFYLNLGHEHFSGYVIETNTLINEDEL